jgi:CheY-like chemotaxis protein
MDGFTFIEELKKRVQPPLPPVIVMTALTLTEEDRNRLNGSVSIILEKHAMTPTDLAKDIRQRISQVGITPQS